MTVFDKNVAATASIILAITIGIGAFGAHGLKDLLNESSLATFEVGVRYQMYHGLAILILGLVPLIPQKLKRRIFWLFIIGIIFFSGSIYLLSLNTLISFDTSVIGFITPIGGLLFMLGWVLLAFGIIKLKKR